MPHIDRPVLSKVQVTGTASIYRNRVLLSNHMHILVFEPEMLR